MARIILNRIDLERLTEKALENACAYCAMGNYKLMFRYWGEADVYIGMLEDMDVYIDEENDHVEGMLDALREDSKNITITR